jgi:hypothetical protein
MRHEGVEWGGNKACIQDLFLKGAKVERRKIEEMNQFMYIIHINMECLRETPCVAILNKQKCHFIFLLQN